MYVHSTVTLEGNTKQLEQTMQYIYHSRIFDSVENIIEKRTWIFEKMLLAKFNSIKREVEIRSFF